MKIYLDMDGVLADFDKKYEEAFKVHPNTLKPGSKEGMRNWDAFVYAGLFTTLELMPNAKKLLAFVDSLDVPVEILSSSGGIRHHDLVYAQKMVWLKANKIAYKPNIVPGGEKKAKFATKTNILIDDTKRVIDSYRAAGGTAILYEDENIDQAIAKLNKFRELITHE